MLIPDDLQYSRDHHWVRNEGGVWRVGITDFAQDALGEISLVRLVSAGSTVGAGDEMGEIEAFKAMSDLYMPTAATMVAHNDELADEPSLVNTEPYGRGWLCLVRPVSVGDHADLLDADGYRALIGVPADV